jgi:thermitase
VRGLTTVRKWKLWTLLLALAAGRLGAACEWDGPPSARAHVPGELLVGLTGERPASGVLASVYVCAGREEEQSSALGICRVKLHPGVDVADAIARLRGMPGVAFAEPNGIVTAAATPSDPLFTSSQWSLRATSADRAWEIWNPVAPVTIAIVDTGIDSTHPDLTRKILRDAQGIVGYNAWTDARSDALDDHWHGTHCAGIAAAEVNNGIGIAGVAGWDGRAGSADDTFIRLMPIKVLDRSASGDDWRVGKGIVWAVDNGAKVISLSLTTNVADQTMARAVSYALSRGCVVVAAAGNAGTSQLNYPAAFPGVLSVASTNRSNQLSDFSNYGPWVNVAAPGEGILSTAPTYPTGSFMPSEYRSATGTSMACPHVAGAAALILAQNPRLTPSQVVNLITTSADPYTPYAGRTLAFGSGRLNVLSALRRAGGSAVSSQPVAIPSAVSLEPPTVVGGGPVQVTVTLAAPPPAEARLSISASNPAVTPPASVVVPAGATKVTFDLATRPVSLAGSATVTVEGGGTRRSVVLRILPPPPVLASITVAPETVTGGRTTRVTLMLSGPAPSGGARVTLQTPTPELAALPASVTVSAGATAVAFTLTTRRVATPSSLRFTAVYGASEGATEITLVPASLIGFTLRPNLVRAGLPTIGTVTLDTPAPEGGLRVELTTSDPSVGTVEPFVLVPAGATSASFTIPTNPASPARAVTFRASYLGISRSVMLRLL